MHRRFLLLAGAAIGAAAAALAGPVLASAHAVFTAGQYRLAVGWENEVSGGTIAYVGEPNAVQLFVDTATPSGDIGNPVSDLNSDCTKPDLQVTVTFGGKTSSPQCLQPAYDPDTGLGRMDEYDATMTPTKVGDYTFRVFGTVHGTQVDKTVKSGSTTFATVADQSSVQFPVSAPALGDVATKVDQVDTRAQNAANSATGATVIAIVGLVVAVVAIAGSVIVVRRRT